VRRESEIPWTGFVWSHADHATVERWAARVVGVAPGSCQAVVEPRAELAQDSSPAAQVWIDTQVYEVEGALALDIDAVEQLFPEGLVGAIHSATLELLQWLAADEENWSRPAPLLVPRAELAERRRTTGPRVRCRRGCCTRRSSPRRPGCPSAPPSSPRAARSATGNWRRGPAASPGV
jgi:hypothetical protein